MYELWRNTIVPDVPTATATASNMTRYAVDAGMCVWKSFSLLIIKLNGVNLLLNFRKICR